MTRRIPDEVYRQRLLSQYAIDANGCWIWQGPVNAWGYGFFPYRGTNAAHRAMYILTKGPAPKGIRVCHACDVRLCINPDHLWLGTQSENIRDCVAKNRQANASKTHCTRGHSYAEHGVRHGKDQWRQCRICARGRQRVRDGWSVADAYSIALIPAVERGRRRWLHNAQS